MQLNMKFVNRISSVVYRKKQECLPLDDTRYTINQKGISLLIVIVVVAVVIAGVSIVAIPQLRKTFLPAQKQTESSPSASPKQYSDKQKLYLRNEEAIKKGLNLTDQQFDLLVENADKN